MTLAVSAPEIALLEVETEADKIPFIISCFALTPIFTACAALIEILLSAVSLLPTIAFLSVKNMFSAKVPPTEFPPPEPAIANATFVMSV